MKDMTEIQRLVKEKSARLVAESAGFAISEDSSNRISLQLDGKRIARFIFTESGKIDLLVLERHPDIEKRFPWKERSANSNGHQKTTGDLSDIELVFSILKTFSGSEKNGKYEPVPSNKVPAPDFPLGNPHPHYTDTVVKQYERSDAIRQYILKLANGICECCEKKAPFVDKDNNPYLEVHHLQPLSLKGPDIIENTVAICPNCHRELHLGREREQTLNNLCARIKRLNMPTIF